MSLLKNNGSAPEIKNFGPNITFDYGSRAAALWLDR